MIPKERKKELRRQEKKGKGRTQEQAVSAATGPAP